MKSTPTKRAYLSFMDETNAKDYEDNMQIAYAQHIYDLGKTPEEIALATTFNALKVFGLSQ